MNTPIKARKNNIRNNLIKRFRIKQSQLWFHLLHAEPVKVVGKMKVTTIMVKTNKYMDGFYNVELTAFGGGEFFGHCVQALKDAFNSIERSQLKYGKEFYISGHYIRILSKTVTFEG